MTSQLLHSLPFRLRPFFHLTNRKKPKALPSRKTPTRMGITYIGIAGTEQRNAELFDTVDNYIWTFNTDLMKSESSSKNWFYLNINAKFDLFHTAYIIHNCPSFKCLTSPCLKWYLNILFIHHSLIRITIIRCI